MATTDHSNSYQQDYFRRLRKRTTPVQSMAPLWLLAAALADAWLTGTPLMTGTRAIALLIGAFVLGVLLLVLARTRTITSHGWTVIALLCVVEMSLAFITTPEPRSMLWLLPMMMALPVMIAPFWLHYSRAIASCVLCYSCAFILPLRTGVDSTVLVAYVIEATLLTLGCLSIFSAIDRVRRGAYKVQQHLEHQARHDALTGLPTRRRFLALGENAVEVAHSSGEPLCLAFVDLDNFKSINDQHGHSSGDRALQMVAEVLSRRLLADMVAARMGGEEFVLLVPGVALETGTAVVDALRHEISELDVGGFHVTVSAGVAQLRRRETLANLMMRADKAMLEAKGAGRDRVLTAT